MNIEKLQERIDHLDKWAQGRLPPQTAVDFGYVLEAARLVANPNIEAAHRAMRALMPREWEREPFPKAFAEIIIEAALTEGDTDE